jgi:HK97 family phage portal protein
MALADWALRAAGLAGTRSDSVRPPAGAVSSPIYNSVPHQPLWPAFEGPSSINLSERNIYAARCIEQIANSISGLPIVAGNVKSRTPRPTTRLQGLLGEAPGGPNPLWSSTKLKRYSVMQYLILGKFAWLHEFDKAGNIVALWPLMAQWLVPVVAGTGSPDYFEKFRYGAMGSPGYREFTPDQITYIWRPSLHDFRQPSSPLALAAWGINIMHMLDQFDHGFLGNGGVPAHMVTTPGFEDKAQRRAFRDQFRRKFGGPQNINKVMFAEYNDDPGEFGSTPSSASVDVKVIGQSQKDSQFDVLRDSRIRDMCVAFGVPLSLLGNSADSKYTNMQTDRDNYWKETISPKLTELADAINLTLGAKLDGINDVCWFDTANVPELRKAPTLPPAEGLQAVDRGYITPDEWRDDLNLPPLPDGAGEKPRELTAVPAPVAEPVPAEDPASTPPPPVRAAAVRVDLLGVVRAQLATELSAAQAEITARLAGKRGGRKRAHASLDLSLAYEPEHWAGRLVSNLGPALRAAGFSDPQIEGWSEDVTEQVREHLHVQQSMQGGFSTEAMMGLLGQQSGQVDAGYVAAALAQIQSGGLAAGDVLTALGGAA